MPPTIGNELFHQSPVGLTEVEDKVTNRKKYWFHIYQNPDRWVRIVIESSILSRFVAFPACQTGLRLKIDRDLKVQSVNSRDSKFEA
jgi:hypothetical protein